ncbi:hypothetical protein BDV95DRAFT_604877 [Massariosphaeria phaeospora]|uniref:Uncharacterized protein n=1 Tax=Massariosphaeria phaeospora TaxID=100035 RepID=A0A7C8IG49_9PLEO|nr:hypothetical protein BDV95DRAFT_604877 [Massariosphaeria phaeospora]
MHLQNIFFSVLVPTITIAHAAVMASERPSTLKVLELLHRSAPIKWSLTKRGDVEHKITVLNATQFNAVEAELWGPTKMRRAALPVHRPYPLEKRAGMSSTVECTEGGSWATQQTLENYAKEIANEFKSTEAGDDSIIILLRRDKNIKDDDMSIVYREDIIKYDQGIRDDGYSNLHKLIWDPACRGPDNPDTRGGILTVWNDSVAYFKFHVDPTTDNCNC